MCYIIDSEPCSFDEAGKLQVLRDGLKKAYFKVVYGFPVILMLYIDNLFLTGNES